MSTNKYKYIILYVLLWKTAVIKKELLLIYYEEYSLKNQTFLS